MEEFMEFDDEKQIRESLSQVKKELAERAERITEARNAKADRSEREREDRIEKRHQERAEREEKEYKLKHADVIAYEFAMFDASEILHRAVEKKMITKKASEWVVKELIRAEGKSLQKLRKFFQSGKW